MPVYIGLQGSSPGAGKDTAYEIIKEYAESKGMRVQRIAFADPIKEIAMKILGSNDTSLKAANNFKLKGNIEWHGAPDTYWWRPEKLNGREFIQNIGEAIKDIDPAFWVYAALDSIDPDADIVVFTDVRFEIEARKIKYLEGEIYYIDSTKRTKKHPNKKVEGWYDEKYITDTIDNNGTPDEFKESVLNLIKENYKW